MTTKRASWSTTIVTVVAIVEIGFGLAMHPSLCRSSDAVAVLQVPADACVALYGPGPCRAHHQRDLHDQ